MEDDAFFDEAEDDEIGELFRRVMIQRYPNPERIGCPDPRILRDLAFRRKIAPEIRRDAISHIMKCSECVRDVLDYTEEYKQTTEQ